MQKKDIAKLVEEFMGVFVEDFVEVLASAIAEKVILKTGGTCKCSAPAEENGLGEAKVLMKEKEDKEKQDKEFTAQKERLSKQIKKDKQKREAKAEPESCGITFEQMQGAAKTVSGRLKSSAKVKETIAKHAKGPAGILREVPEEKYPQLLEDLESLLGGE